MNFTARILAAPVHFTAEKVLNRSLFKAEYINILSWEANPDNENVTKYRIYLGEGSNPILLGETSAAEKKYMHRGVDKNRTYTYELVAVNDKNREGLPAILTVK